MFPPPDVYVAFSQQDAVTALSVCKKLVRVTTRVCKRSGSGAWDWLGNLGSQVAIPILVWKFGRMLGREKARLWRG